MRDIKIFLTMLLILIFGLFLTAGNILAATDDDIKKENSDISESRLLYTPEHQSGYVLERFLRVYLEGERDYSVYYHEELNTLFIKAPKSSHKLLLKMLEEYDQKPENVVLNAYLLAAAPKDAMTREMSELLEPALNGLRKYSTTQNFELLGEGMINFPLNKKNQDVMFFLKMDGNTEGRYQLILSKFTNTESSVNIQNLLLRYFPIPGNTSIREQVFEAPTILEYGKPVGVVKVADNTGKKTLALVLLLKKSE
ncbi:MAG: hypothetical protein JW737_02335 [Acidobacteria bacterium]|nr:hypothetical protein [Acidobacteriota bacterium]